MQGEFGHPVPVRPATGNGSERTPTRCLRGHVLAVAGAGSGWSHFYSLPDVTCRVCRQLGDPVATWCLIDPTVQYSADGAPTQGLVLVVILPSVRGGVGRIELRLDDRVVGDVDLRACGPCATAVLEHIRVDQQFRGIGYGRVLAAAAFVRAPASRYRWSSTEVNKSVEAWAFWAAVGFPARLGQPEYCADMIHAD